MCLAEGLDCAKALRKVLVSNVQIKKSKASLQGEWMWGWVMRDGVRQVEEWSGLSDTAETSGTGTFWSILPLAFYCSYCKEVPCMETDPSLVLSLDWVLAPVTARVTWNIWSLVPLFWGTHTHTCAHTQHTIASCIMLFPFRLSLSYTDCASKATTFAGQISVLSPLSTIERVPSNSNS